MALLYRAIWTDEPADGLDFGHRLFAAWVTRKYPRLVVPREGSSETADGRIDATVVRAEQLPVRAIRCALHEERDVQRWTTTLTVITQPEEGTSLWVDLEMVSADSFRLPDTQPPGLVRDLINAGPKPHRGPVTLGIDAEYRTPDKVHALVDQVLDPTRDIPILVFTADPFGGIELAKRRAQDAARFLIGVVSVQVLSPLSVDDFIDGVGRPLGVWGGAARVFLPGTTRDGSPYRHFVMTQEVINRDLGAAGRIVASRLGGAIAARRAPTGYEAVRSVLNRVTAGQTVEQLESQLLTALTDNDQLKAEADQLRAQLDEQVGLRYDAYDDLEDTNEELAQSQNLANRYREVLARANVDPAAWEAPSSDVGEGGLPPELVSSSTEAVDAARRWLARLRIPDGALVAIDELDAVVESRARGQTAWRAFRALDAYATSAHRFNGFWDWCEHSGDPYAWPATSKKLAMAESETVMQAPKLLAKRQLPVDPAVDPSEVVLMTSHMKIAEGGGPLAPRIYFHDDTKGTTGHVHVGFFGPHRDMPNKSTN